MKLNNNQQFWLTISIIIVVALALLSFLIKVISDSDHAQNKQTIDFIETCKSKDGIPNTHDYEWRCIKL